jgi:hypothetical protein
MGKVGFVSSYWLEKQLIEIGRLLRQQNSSCHYNDYVNVFRTKDGSKISVEISTKYHSEVCLII